MDKLWLIGGALVLSAIGVTVYALSEEEKKARQRWHKKRKEVELTLEEHQERIARHIEEANTSYNFHFLVNLHYSSVMCANESYKLLNDARTTLKGIYKMLDSTREHKNKLKSELNKSKKDNNNSRFRELLEEIRLINKTRSDLFEELNSIKAQKEKLLQKVKELNRQTARLKHYIKERCGSKGQEWYERLEQRTRQRKLGLI